MDRTTPPSFPNRLPECSFCSNPPPEIRIILKTALLRIRKILLQQKYWEVLEEGPTAPQPTPGVHRLIRVLFQRNQFELKYSKECSHDRLRTLLRKTLKCKASQLEMAIEQLCDKMARRNYELQLISLQVKNVENSVFQLQDSQQVSTKTRKQSHSSRSDEPLLPAEHMVKLEEVQRVETDAVPVLQAYNSAYDGIPYYNIIYYGSSYFQ